MMKIEFYDKLYIAEDDELVSEELKDEHMVWVSKHWDWVYNKKPKDCISDTLENYTLVFCESKEEFERLEAKLDPKNANIFDYSFEFKYPSVMIEMEYLKQCLN